MNRPLCPILTIGFDPPEKGKPDIRRCSEECALFDVELDCCSVVSVLDELRDLKEVIFTNAFETEYESYTGS